MKMRTKPFARLTALGLALALLLTACGGGASATTMNLRKTEGTVGVSDGEGKDVAPKDNLGLYSGYQVGTQAESYAWIDLDKVKLTKMDAESEVEITKDGKKLEIDVKSGSLFFNVTEPLAEDETLNIRTSSMAVGIRGTCGWVTQDIAALLEGTVSVEAGGQTATVNAGEMAVLANGTLEVVEFSSQDIPAFVREELEEDEELAEVPGNDADGPDEEEEKPVWSISYDADGTPMSRTEYDRSDPDSNEWTGYHWVDGAWELDGTFYTETGVDTESTKDGRGRVVEQTVYRDGVLQQHDIRIEDEEDYSVYRSTYYYNGETDESTYTIYYDSQGQETKYESEYGYSIYTYDEQGRMTRIDSYQADGTLNMYWIQGYDGDSEPD